MIYRSKGYKIYIYICLVFLNAETVYCFFNNIHYLIAWAEIHLDKKVAKVLVPGEDDDAAVTPLAINNIYPPPRAFLKIIKVCQDTSN